MCAIINYCYVVPLSVGYKCVPEKVIGTAAGACGGKANSAGVFISLRLIAHIHIHTGIQNWGNHCFKYT